MDSHRTAADREGCRPGRRCAPRLFQYPSRRLSTTGRESRVTSGGHSAWRTLN